MLLKVAWKNVWRNKVRSSVIILAIALGLWAGVFASAFVRGMMEQKVESIISMEVSHFQFHQPKFRDELQPDYYMANARSIQDSLEKEEEVFATSGRLLSLAMIKSANASGAIKLAGISPAEEALVSKLDQKVIDGQYFEGVSRNPILISQETAKKYKVKVRSKLVLTLQDIEGEFAMAAFKVVGIYNTGNAMYDKSNIFARRQDIQKLLGIETGLHEIAVSLKTNELSESMAEKYQQDYPSLEVMPWMDLMPGMRYMIETMDIYTIMIVGIIEIALLFSIINTMLMAVLERTRELGMLMAIGMRKPKVFSMIMIETVYLSLVGGPLGLLLAYLAVQYFGKYGIDLGDAAYGEMGFSNIVYPFLAAAEYLNVAIMVLIMAILAAIFPAYKALQLNPAEAIRKI